MALDFIQGKWTDSFHMLYSFKAEVEKTSPGSVVNIDYEVVKGRERSRGGSGISRQIRYASGDVLSA